MVRVNPVLRQDRAHFLIQVPAVQRLKPVLYFHQAVQALLIGRLRKTMKLCQQLSGFRECTRHHFISGTSIIDWKILRQHRKYGAIIQTHNAAVRHLMATDNLKQSRLTLAVAAQKTDSLACLHGH